VTSSNVSYLFFFFFQAEDGIRDRNVTGVQTCALPISDEPDRAQWAGGPGTGRPSRRTCCASTAAAAPGTARPWRRSSPRPPAAEIGRASCRERVEIAGAAGALQ